MATLLVGSAQRLLGQTATALITLGGLTSFATVPPRRALRACPGQWPPIATATASPMRRAGELNPRSPGVWRSLADQLRTLGDAEGADAAYMLHVKAGPRDPQLLRPAAALFKNEIPEAERLLRAHLGDYPTDVAALRMLAETLARTGRYPEAEALLVRCLELAPSFAEARAHYATLLDRCNRPVDALQQIDRLPARRPLPPPPPQLCGFARHRRGISKRAYELCVELLAEYPTHPRTWLNYGIVSKTTGRYNEAIQSVSQRPRACPTPLGEAWWSLANLKTFSFSAAEIVAMQRGLEHTESADDDLLKLHCTRQSLRRRYRSTSSPFGITLRETASVASSGVTAPSTTPVLPSVPRQCIRASFCASAPRPAFPPPTPYSSLAYHVPALP